ncbi:hypothetical protein [Parasediminibacterium sp. JCM 36343]|uniref:hypothetical protein n=1 Tax=Parasediminibacterium sp. JCM 36343 TaxID=3374279 RepID=UPI003978A751
MIENYCAGKVILPNYELNCPFIGRCRPNEYSSKKSEVFSKVCEISYKKVEIKQGRCNYDDQQVFYGALNCLSSNATTISTIVAETCMDFIINETENLKYLTVSRWIVARPLNIVILPFSKASFTQNETFRFAKESFENDLNSIGMRDDFIDSYTEFLEFMSDIFCKIENKKLYYRISSAFYNFIMDAAKEDMIDFDGLVYPSANTDAAGANICLKKELVKNEILYCERVQMVKGTRSNQNKKQLNFYPASNEAFVKADKTFEFKIW